MTKKYDVIIVGGGPAGIFAALELALDDLRILLLEGGRDIDKRQCPARDTGQPCPPCSPCDLVCGLGGAGAFSDGKLTLTSRVGGRLPGYLGEDQTEALIKYVDEVYLKFGAPDKLYGTGKKVDKLRQQADLAGLKLVPMPIRHLGTEHCRLVLKAMWDNLSPHIESRLRTAVSSIIVERGKVKGVKTEAGESFECDYLILAPGREGADWLAKEAERLKLTMHSNPVDVGVRVEVPAAVMAPLTDVLYESKLEFLSKSFDDRVRTFCMCPGGEVIMESTGGCDPVITVNGHSYAERKTENTNFALLVSTAFTKPFNQPIAYGRYLARLANILSSGVLLQRLGDLMEGRRSTPERIERGLTKPTLQNATPGDLSFALPYRYITDLVEMLQAMDKLVPGVASHHTLLYGIEVKFYSSRPQLSPSLETEVGNMFAVGDGAGVSRGLIQASVSGVVAAREIVRRR
ncbi:MAG: NAD(P)/FAD-dependent oxidoreductase [Dehalococcoidia bacterium]|nr:MAG: NAD(P)/FAD-dependent oxidoreductase [Dehalococcoidia bacterium]